MFYLWDVVEHQEPGSISIIGVRNSVISQSFNLSEIGEGAVEDVDSGESGSDEKNSVSYFSALLPLNFRCGTPPLCFGAGPQYSESFSMGNHYTR